LVVKWLKDWAPFRIDLDCLNPKLGILELGVTAPVNADSLLVMFEKLFKWEPAPLQGADGLLEFKQILFQRNSICNRFCFRFTHGSFPEGEAQPPKEGMPSESGS
jgi:hypothetical protein